MIVLTSIGPIKALRKRLSIQLFALSLVLSLCIKKYLFWKYIQGFNLQGASVYKGFLGEHAIRCHELFRKKKHVFVKHFITSRERQLLKDNREVTVEEQMAIVLMTISTMEEIECYKNGLNIFVK